MLDLPPENLIVCGLSFGYADPGSPLNALDMPRAALDAFMGFSG